MDSAHPKDCSAKVLDPKKLSNRESFDHWEVEIYGKFEVNADHFDNEKAKMYYVYSLTEGDAKKHLYPRYKPKAVYPFKSA